MSDQGHTNLERLADLMADRALGLLSPDDSAELDRLLALHPELDPETMELAAAAAHVALLGGVSEMPAALRASIAREAASVLPGVDRGRSVRAPSDGAGDWEEESREPRDRIRAWGVAGWIAAAACLTLAISSWLSSPRGGRASNFAQLHTELASKPGSTEIVWTPTEDPAGRQVGGDVVWNQGEGKGSIRLTGLPVNDPGANQYQLWVFTEPGLESHPLDGGVFDVDPATGIATMPIEANLRGAKPTAFAITIERPGGVRVSDRSRLVALAKAPS